MTKETTKNKTLHEEAVTNTQNQKGENMGVQERQDQQGAGQNNQPINDRKEVKTMSNDLNDYLIPIEGADPETGAVKINKIDYDGSRQPMVIESNLESSEAISNAYLRIKVRYNFLMKDYFHQKSIFEDESRSAIDRKLAKDKVSKIDEDLEKLQALNAKVERQEKVVEERVKAELVDTDVTLRHSFKP